MAVLLLLTLLSLSFPILSLSEYINIDCGASESYLDSDNVKSWVGDKGFTTTGKSFENNAWTKPFNTLRSFPSKNKNCYSNIPATRGRKTLVRTMFFYGNYDRKSLPPSFDVVYDEIHRDRVEFTVLSQLNNKAIFISEVIYSPASEDISVCLIRTYVSDVPFISSIEVYGLDADMYGDLGPDEGLIRQKLVPYGYKNFNRDQFGRLWFPLKPLDPGSSELKTSAPSIDIMGVPNKPPENVMAKALSQDIIRLSDETLPSAGRPIYLALYFSEPESLGRTMTRSFNVFLDNKQLNSVPIEPVLGKATAFVIRNIVATSESNVSFKSTKDSTLPPIVNAIELYSISKGDGADYGGGQSGDFTDRDKGPKGPKPKPNEKATEDARLKFEAAKEAATQKGKPKSKLPVILGASFASVFAALSSMFAAIFCKRSQNAKSQSNTEPAMSTGSAAEAGVEPLVGQQLASDASHPGKDKTGVV